MWCKFSAYTHTHTLISKPMEIVTKLFIHNHLENTARIMWFGMYSSKKEFRSFVVVVVVFIQTQERLWCLSLERKLRDAMRESKRIVEMGHIGPENIFIMFFVHGKVCWPCYLFIICTHRCMSARLCMCVRQPYKCFFSPAEMMWCYSAVRRWWRQMKKRRRREKNILRPFFFLLKSDVEMCTFVCLWAI